MKVNHVGPKDPLSVGKKLLIPDGSARGNSAAQVVRKVRYKVLRGDSLSRIASKFNVSIQDITKWNNLDSSRYLQPGEGLLLYVNVLGN